MKDRAGISSGVSLPGGEVSGSRSELSASCRALWRSVSYDVLDRMEAYVFRFNIQVFSVVALLSSSVVHCSISC